MQSLTMYLNRLCWYVAEKYLRDLKAKEDLPTRVMESIEALAIFLVSEIHTIERGSESGRREAKDMVPSDKVKDPHATARELRWRARLALGGHSGDEGKSKPKISHTVNGSNKRKREAEDAKQSAEPEHIRAVTYKHFKPRDWDVERRLPGGLSVVRRKAAR